MNANVDYDNGDFSDDDYDGAGDDDDGNNDNDDDDDEEINDDDGDDDDDDYDDDDNDDECLRIDTLNLSNGLCIANSLVWCTGWRTLVWRHCVMHPSRVLCVL